MMAFPALDRARLWRRRRERGFFICRGPLPRNRIPHSKRRALRYLLYSEGVAWVGSKNLALTRPYAASEPFLLPLTPRFLPKTSRSEGMKPKYYMEGLDRSTARSEALKLLARRELSVAQVRARLRDRGHSPQAIDDAIAQLCESEALDDRRVARAYARTAAAVKGRGRLRVVRELQAIGIAKDIIAEAVGEVFADLPETTLLQQAIEKKLRGRRVETAQDRARLYRSLLQQGFPGAAISDAIRTLASGRTTSRR